MAALGPDASQQSSRQPLKEQLDFPRMGNMSVEYEELEDEDYESDFEESASDASDDEEF